MMIAIAACVGDKKEEDDDSMINQKHAMTTSQECHKLVTYRCTAR